MKPAREHLAHVGLDLVVSFARSWADADSGPPSHLPTMSVADPLCLLIGNSKALWPRFLAAYAAGETPTEHPLDRWVEAQIRHAASLIDAETAVCMSYAPPEVRVPLQHVAQRVGFAHLSPSHLSIHPDYGPWVGLRAVLVVDRPGPTGPAPTAPDPCGACDEPCMDALRVAMAGHDVPERQAVQADWRHWAAMRQVCPIGSHEAYGPDQLRYHYTHDPTVLPRRY